MNNEMTMSFNRDNSGRRFCSTSASKILRAYDPANGRLTSVTNRNGRLTAYDYDNRNQFGGHHT